MSDSRPNLRLLSFDGGGVRGLASLYILRQLMSHIGNPKPCDYFDMICGTSTGGLIAIMLGRLELTVDQCIEAFLRLMGSIFAGKKSKLPFKLSNGKVKARYETRKLEDAILEVIKQAGFHSDDLMRGPKESTCKVFVVALTDEGKTTVHFTDYAIPNEQSNFYNQVKIWEAARATAAATSFFEPITIAADNVARKYVDGALGNNNPVNELWMEARSRFCPGAALLPRVQVLLSIGTGRPAQTQLGERAATVTKSIVTIATDTEKTAATFYRMHSDLVDRRGYFRFNPPDLTEVHLDEASKSNIIHQRCEAYGNDPTTEALMVEWSKAARNGYSTWDSSSLRPQQAIQHIEYTILMHGVEALKIIKSDASRPITNDFHTLGSGDIYINTKGKSYWQYLTLDSYHVYERIYNGCKNRNGMVNYASFAKHFHASKPPPWTIQETWSRVLRDKRDIESSTLAKSLVMAVLYMLHIDSMRNHTRPKLMNNAEGINRDRREALKRFTKWIPCHCDRGCEREWNFVNDLGLYRSERNGLACRVAKLFERSRWKNMLAEKESKWLEDMRDAWKAAEA